MNCIRISKYICDLGNYQVTTMDTLHSYDVRAYVLAYKM